MISAMLTIDLPLQCRLSIVGRRVKHLPQNLLPPKKDKEVEIPKRAVIPSGISTAIDTTVSTLEMHSEDGDDDDDDDPNAI